MTAAQAADGGMKMQKPTTKQIASAPELLEALTNLESYLRDTPHHNAVDAAAARAVIAKATSK
jgi:hypothetical protein